MVSNAWLQMYDTLMIQLFIKIENGILCYLWKKIGLVWLAPINALPPFPILKPLWLDEPQLKNP